MPKTMLVNVTHVEESRVAILEDGVLAAYEIETTNRSNIVGNMYNAVVDNVLPSLEAAFVKIGSDLNGFLPIDEVNFNLLPSRRDVRGKGKISQHVHQGQKLLVQVVRGPLGSKPPTVTTYFSLPGRFLVLMPGVDATGISRKIDDADQRDRLKRIVEELEPPEGFGVIVRTAGFGQTKAELQRDLRYLLRLWEAVQRSSRAGEFPGLVYQERDLVTRTIRDHFTPDISEVWIDSKETHDRAMAFMRDVMPTKVKTLRFYTGERPLFNKFNLEEQIERIYKRRVALPSGGEIVIDGTEALTAIDVNSARSARRGDAEETAAQTNVEAADEIARQLRLRDLGGLIVIDFIDMASARNRKKIEKAMRDGLRGDRARYDITRLSKLGLMEIARQRLREEKLRVSYKTCPTCDGYGLVKTVEAAALAALRKLQTRTSRGDLSAVRLGVPQDVAAWILNNKREDLAALERRHDVRLEVVTNPKLLPHECEIETVARPKTETRAQKAEPREDASSLPTRLSAEAEIKAPPPGETTGDEALAAVAAPFAGDEERASAPGRRRRKRRRRRARTAEGGAEEAVGAPAAGEGAGDEVPEGATSAAPQETEPESESETDEAAASSAGKRRRRRRRKRPRAPGEQATAEPPPASGGGARDTARGRPERPAPAKIDRDQLMPAATGAAQRAEVRKSRTRRGSTRRSSKSKE